VIDAVHAFVASVDGARHSVVEDRRRTGRARPGAADFDAVAEQAVCALGRQRALAPRAVVLAAVAVDGVAVVAGLAGIRVAVPAARGGSVHGRVAAAIGARVYGRVAAAVGTSVYFAAAIGAGVYLAAAIGAGVYLACAVGTGVYLACAVGTGVRLLRTSRAFVGVIAAGGDDEHGRHTQANDSA
jgi:hypothetical protein